MPFTFTATPIDGLLVIQTGRFVDERGFFLETYKRSEFEKAGIREGFVQDNHSRSVKGVLRGLHFQNPPHAQAKLVRVVLGRVWDVAVDVRPGSSSYGAWWAIELCGEDDKALYIPAGFAHGFLTLSDEAHLVYKCSDEYDKASDRGIRWDDPDIAIEWPARDVMVSEKDAALPYLKDFR
jgi:dTDP-4-dehydrorhamnose 3,5-epimerase